MYEGIECWEFEENGERGFNVYLCEGFFDRDFCKKYAQHVIAEWGEDGKYLEMDAHRIAIELFGHAWLMAMGIQSKDTSKWFWLHSYKKPKHIDLALKGMAVCTSEIYHYLYNKTYEISVNEYEPWYKVMIYESIWLNNWYR